MLALNVLRMIKLFAWEPYMLRRLSNHREDELRKIRTNKILDATMDNLNMLLPAIAKITTFATYVRGLYDGFKLSCVDKLICCVMKALVIKGDLSCKSSLDLCMTFGSSRGNLLS